MNKHQYQGFTKTEWSLNELAETSQTAIVGFFLLSQLFGVREWPRLEISQLLKMKKLTILFSGLDMNLTGVRHESTVKILRDSSPVCVWSELFLLPPPLELVR